MRTTFTVAFGTCNAPKAQKDLYMVLIHTYVQSYICLKHYILQRS